MPAASMSSSIASLDPLNRGGSVSPGGPLIAGVGMTTLVEGVGAIRVVEEVREMPNGNGGDEEWEEVDVGKGLALYNSMEMDRIKGVKRQVMPFFNAE